VLLFTSYFILSAFYCERCLIARDLMMALVAPKGLITADAAQLSVDVLWVAGE